MKKLILKPGEGAPPPPPLQSTFVPGVYYLCSQDQNIASAPGLTNPNLKGMRLRDTSAVSWTGDNDFNFEALDTQVSLCQENNKAIGLSVAFGVFCPAWLYGMVPYLTLDPEDEFSQPPASGKVPVPWDPAVQNLICSYISALGAHLDGKLSYLAPTGFQINVEGFLGFTDAEKARADASAQAYGYADASAGWLAAGQFFIGKWVEAFPNTAVIFTSQHPFPGETSTQNALEAWCVANGAGYGNAFLKAFVPPYNSPHAVSYPSEYQAVGRSSDSRFYSGGAPSPFPTEPRPVQDLVLGGGLPKGARIVEVYATDCNSAANQAAFPALNAALEANVP